MNIVGPYARIMNLLDRSAGVELLRKIEWCGRISHRSEGAQTEDSWERFIQSVVLEHGDWSIVEHASVTVDFLVDRGVTHEIVRHRLFSFTQESTRFVNYEKKMPPSFLSPIDIPPTSGCALLNSESVMSSVGGRQYAAWSNAVDLAEASYKELLAAGCAPQIARSVLPNALASRLIVTGNLRNWRHFLLMRTTREAHPQMRQVTIPLLDEFKAKIPLLYDDIEPLARQIDNMRKPR